MEDVIAQYNKNVFTYYRDHIISSLEAYEQAGGNVTEDPFPDSFIDRDLVTVLSCGKYKIILIIGAGPVGLYAGLKISKAFQDHTILIMDNRIVEEHIRKPFSRKRYLNGRHKPINQIEKEIYEQLLGQKNVLFYWTRANPEELVHTYGIRYVINATGGRLPVMQNPIQENIGEYEDGRVMFEKRGPVYVMNEDDDGYDWGKSMEPEPGNNKIMLEKDNVITASYGDITFDMAADAPPSKTGVVTKAEAFEIINQLECVIPDMDTIVYTLASFPDEFTLSHYVAGLSVSIRSPAHIHRYDHDYFYKFDIGDGLITLPISLGINVPSSYGLIDNVLIPTFKILLA